jgi:hypothetical protein
MVDELEERVFSQLAPCAPDMTVSALRSLSQDVARRIRAWSPTVAAAPLPVSEEFAPGERSGPGDWSAERPKPGKKPYPLPEPVVGRLAFPLGSRGAGVTAEQRGFIAALRARRGEWFELDLPGERTRANSVASAIKGQSTVFRPAGAFEAVERGARVFARYVGPTSTGRWALDIPETDLVYSVGAGSPFRYQRIAEVLREARGQYVKLTDINGAVSAPDTLASYIRMGQVPEFRPAGSFDAKKRGDDVFACFLGE